MALVKNKKILQTVYMYICLYMSLLQPRRGKQCCLRGMLVGVSQFLSPMLKRLRRTLLQLCKVVANFMLSPNDGKSLLFSLLFALLLFSYSFLLFHFFLTLKELFSREFERSIFKTSDVCERFLFF